jgi:TolA-binding protein
MSEPRRLLDGDASALERLLLESARSDGPKAESMARTAAALGLGVPATMAPPAIGTAALAKWLAGAALVVATGWGGYRYFGTPEAPAPLPQNVRAAPRAESPESAAVSTPLAPTRAPTEGSETRERSSAPATPRSTERSLSRSASLADQVSRLDQVRSLLSGGAPREALAELGRYRATYPRGALSQEAFLLELQAWQASGQASRASRAALDFLRRYPKSPHAERVARFVETP